MLDTDYLILHMIGRTIVRNKIVGRDVKCVDLSSHITKRVIQLRIWLRISVWMIRNVLTLPSVIRWGNNGNLIVVGIIWSDIKTGIMVSGELSFYLMNLLGREHHIRLCDQNIWPLPLEGSCWVSLSWIEVVVVGFDFKIKFDERHKTISWVNPYCVHNWTG